MPAETPPPPSAAQGEHDAKTSHPPKWVWLVTHQLQVQGQLIQDEELDFYVHESVISDIQQAQHKHVFFDDFFQLMEVDE
jgi:hypothetical protein